MDACGILIIGGGPAGSSCAWKLRQAGYDVLILDKKSFPRDKTCGGWITPAVLDELRIDPQEYARERVLQPITGFRTSCMGGPEIETSYAGAVSYGIRRLEFDHFLLRRSGARVLEGVPLTSLARSGNTWVVNGDIRADMLVGAGGHFCPVARHLGANARKEIAVTAQEIEFEMSPQQREGCAIQAEIPELYFCPDMKGYGWCFRKGNFLNVGLGRLDPHGFPGYAASFLGFLKRAGKIRFSLPQGHMPGHAYLLFDETPRQITDDGVLLAGDAAGLAYAQSGEGIRPAVESGLLAAETIMAAKGDYARSELGRYRESLQARFGESGKDWTSALGRHLPGNLLQCVARVLLANGWLSRRLVLDRWFLHRNEPPLARHATA